jgi:hypothetical protein
VHLSRQTPRPPISLVLRAPCAGMCERKMKVEMSVLALQVGAVVLLDIAVFAYEYYSAMQGKTPFS